MSNSNGGQTLVKSMNGILSFNTGGGVIISGDTIVADTIDLTNLNIDNIQGIAPADNITLFTDTTGDIYCFRRRNKNTYIECASKGFCGN